MATILKSPSFFNNDIFLWQQGWRSWLDLWLPTRRSRVQAPAWSRVELWVTFFRHTVRGQGRQAVGLVSRRSIGGLKRTHTLVDKSRLMPVLWTVNWGHNLMSQTKNPCEPLVAVWLKPSTTEPCICCKQVAEKPRGEHLKMMYVWCMYVTS